ncbi:dephospho-CoA kinase [Mycoplasma leonicaptivi]|uniref:dephospho-CoA kinase n=1 Tax=Mycoplasma leonicaptivi TaxID=36742 RepID=UPI000688056C|nr:dephospho-CoA kinase [Mycoplasma leonicaptivi]
MVAIVGKISSGKTTLLNYFQKLGYKTFNSDIFVNQLYNNSEFCFNARKKISYDIFTNDNLISKIKIKNIIFKDTNLLFELETLVFEEIYKHLKENKYDFVEIPILFNAPKKVIKLFNEIFFLNNNFFKIEKNNVIQERIKKLLNTLNSFDWDSYETFFEIPIYNVVFSKNKNNTKCIKIQIKKRKKY